MGYVSAKRKFLICLVKQTQTSHLPNFCQNQTWWALTSSLLIINISIVRYIISVLVAYHLNQNVPLRRAISQHFRISDQLLCKKNYGSGFRIGCWSARRTDVFKANYFDHANLSLVL